MPASLTCVKTGDHAIGMTTIPYPDTPGPGQAIVRTTLSTICGSDIHIVDELPIPAGTPMGHEAVGVVDVERSRTLGRRALHHDQRDASPARDREGGLVVVADAEHHHGVHGRVVEQRALPFLASGLRDEEHANAHGAEVGDEGVEDAQVQGVAE